MTKKQLIVLTTLFGTSLMIYYRKEIKNKYHEVIEGRIKKYFDRKKILSCLQREQLKIYEKILSLLSYFNREKEALMILGKITAIDRRNEEMLHRKFLLEQKYNLHEEGLYTITILSHIDKKYLGLKKRFFKGLLNKTYGESIFPHYFHIEQILNTFPSLTVSYDEIREKYFSEDGEEQVLFYKGLVEHVLCNNKKANEHLKNLTDHNSIILYSYINNRPIPEYILKAHKDDFSTNLYNVIINKKETPFIEERIRQFHSHKNVYLFHILKVHNILNSKSTDDAMQDIDSMNFTNINIYKFIINYLIHNNLSHFIGHYIKYIEDDVLYFNLYMGIWKNEEEYFIRAIEKSEGFFEPYFRYATYLMNRGDKRFMNVYDLANKYASTYEELRMVRQVLLSLDVYKRLYEEYPEFEE